MYCNTMIYKCLNSYLAAHDNHDTKALGLPFHWTEENNILAASQHEDYAGYADYAKCQV